jgi:hypothetical protein
VRVKVDPAAPTTTASAEALPGGGSKVTLTATDAGAGVRSTTYRVDGGPWLPYEAPEEVLFDGTQESFARWRQAPGGQFLLQEDGSIRSIGGLGMLWYPEKAFGDVALKVQWREARTDGGHSNSGLFMRFPFPQDNRTCDPQNRPAWIAIYCGHEIQIYDGPTGEAQKTGSVYNFQPLNLAQAKPAPVGEWNEYEVRTVGGGDYTLTVIRNGEVINTYVNSPGKTSSRPTDPPTNLRQYASGYIGLQNHGASDLTEFRNVRVQDLSPGAAAFTVPAGTRTVEFSSTDAAGNVEAVQVLTLAG